MSGFRTSRHQELLAEAVKASAPVAAALKDAACYITGGSGFLASSLLAFLSELDTAYQLNLRLFASARRPMSDAKLFPFLGLRPKVVWSLASAEETVLPDVEDLIVVHSGSYGAPKDYLRDPLGTFSGNTQGLVNLFGQAKARRARQLVFFSSAEIYGQPPAEAIPTAEHYVGALDTLSVRSIYGESKRMGEVLGACLAEREGIPLTVVRPWNLYGPGQRPDDGRVPIEFVRQGLEQRAIQLASNGSPRRAFCFVWDGIRQIAATLGTFAGVHALPIGWAEGRAEGRSGPGMSAFNIGNSTEEISILDLARKCAAVCGLPDTAVSYDPLAGAPGLQRCVPEVGAVLKLAPGPARFTPLADGLPTLVDWLNFLKSDA
jgi:nucleoside-diphosphate-sugar epimerase